MLCLSRKVGESVIVDNRIRVTVVDIRGDKIRLGFEADPSIPINREEVQDAIDRERREDGAA